MSLILTLIYRGISWGIRVALSRITIVLAFIALIGTAIYSIWGGFEDFVDSIGTFFEMLGAVTFANVVERWATNNEYILIVGYSLALDVFLNTVFDLVFATFCGFLFVCISSIFAVFLYSAPIVADLLCTGLKTQFIKVKL